jgi:thymidylate synthase ThyX
MLSQRYVDESETDFVIPDALQLEVELAGYMINVLQSGQIITNNEDLGWAIIWELPKDHPCKNWLAMDVYLAADAGSEWLASVEGSLNAYKKISDYLQEKIKKQALMDFLRSPAAAGIMACNPNNMQPDQETKTQIRKEARQAARSVLPNATETKIFVTANARSLRHMIEMRASRHADTEIRKLFCKVWEIMVQEAPSIFGDYEKVPLKDGTYELVTKNRKV